MHKIYPWQQQQWQHLIQRKRQNNLPHALLLSGAPGLGKLDFALSFSALLLCNNPNVAHDAQESACGLCSSCQLLKASNHPDFYLLQSENSDKGIKIDQIRELIIELGHTAQQGGYQVVVIEPAHALNAAAANALLKTLEEPIGEQVIFMLVTDRASTLMPTIRSRCQILAFSEPTTVDAKVWLDNQTQFLPQNDGNVLNSEILLNLAYNQPLTALKLRNNDEMLAAREKIFHDAALLFKKELNAIKCAADYLDTDLHYFLSNISNLVLDMIKIKFKINVNLLTHKDKISMLQQFSNTTSFERMYNYLDKLFNWHKVIDENANVNKQLLFEGIWLDWELLF